MSREASTAGHSLKAVSLVLTAVAIISFATLAYSAVADVNGVTSVVAPGGGQRPGVSFEVDSSPNPGQLSRDVTLRLSMTLPNNGLYPISVGLTCPRVPNYTITCSGGSLSIPPGTGGTLNFTMTIHDVSLSKPLPAAVRGNVTVALVPFASVELMLDLSSITGGKV